jgi:hypothetical protein
VPRRALHGHGERLRRHPGAGKASAAKRYALTRVKRSLARGKRVKLKLSFSKTLLKRVRLALGNPRTRNRVRARVTLTVTDAAGNRKTGSRTIRLGR